MPRSLPENTSFHAPLANVRAEKCRSFAEVFFSSAKLCSAAKLAHLNNNCIRSSLFTRNLERETQEAALPLLEL